MLEQKSAKASKVTPRNLLGSESIKNKIKEMKVEIKASNERSSVVKKAKSKKNSAHLENLKNKSPPLNKNISLGSARRSPDGLKLNPNIFQGLFPKFPDTNKISFFTANHIKSNSGDQKDVLMHSGHSKKKHLCNLPLTSLAARQERQALGQGVEHARARQHLPQKNGDVRDHGTPKAVSEHKQ